MTDILADTINKIKGYENNGMYECDVPATKLIRAVLEVLKSHSYVTGFEEVKDGKFKRLRLTMSKRINDIGVIKPRYAVPFGDFRKYEERYIPSVNFGVLIVSTSKGIMTNKEAREQRLGGRLLAFVY
ncbi:MAG: 30S ribosomal protein S8 [Candidatus Marsarchaeota archaeon]|jgi:small subunit ribosomal protein S8|nr:30S ribosomal protein S8 [Candidatus Marsarchaeota archaeon]